MPSAYEPRDLPPDMAAMMVATRAHLSPMGDRAALAAALAVHLDAMPPGGLPQRVAFLAAARAWCAAPGDGAALETLATALFAWVALVRPPRHDRAPARWTGRSGAAASDPDLLTDL